jgi:hypothetical protein
MGAEQIHPISKTTNNSGAINAMPWRPRDIKLTRVNQPKAAA